MSKSLISLTREYQSITNQIIENDGELTPELEQKLSIVELNLPEKIDAYDHILDRLENEAAYWSKKADEMYKVASACKNAHKRLKDNLKYAAIQMGLNEIKGHNSLILLSKAKPSLVINDNLDPAYMMQVVKNEPDKERIRKDLELGVPVKGAELKETLTLRFYPNKESK